MSIGFNAMVRRLMNQENRSFDEAVRELAKRSANVRRAKKLNEERKRVLGRLRTTRTSNPFDGVESPDK